MPNLIKMNIVLITKYLNLKWNIVKSFIFTKKKIGFKMRIFKIVIGFRRTLCAQFNPILHHFRYSAPIDN